MHGCTPACRTSHPELLLGGDQVHQASGGSGCELEWSSSTGFLLQNLQLWLCPLSQDLPCGQMEVAVSVSSLWTSGCWVGLEAASCLYGFCRHVRGSPCSSDSWAAGAPLPPKPGGGLLGSLSE